MSVDAVPQQVEIGLQPDGKAAALDLLARTLVDEGAAPRRDDTWAILEEALDGKRFQRTELQLTIGGKEFGNRHARDALDLGIGIDEGNAELLCNRPADRGLPYPHQS